MIVNESDLRYFFKHPNFSFLLNMCNNLTSSQRHIHGDELEGREEHLGLLGDAREGDVR